MPKRKDYTGEIFGDFTVIEMLYGYNNTGRTYCKCLGVDGKEYIIRQDALQSGATKSISGAGRKQEKKDLIGMRFSRLTVLYDTGRRASNGSVIWHCLCDCGNEIDVSMSHLVEGHTTSCGRRKGSKWEDVISEYLTQKGIKFISQKRFPDCKNKKQTDQLPFDFYLPQKNKIIEYDGQHHFQPVKYWGGEEKFKITQENDRIKNNYCKQHNIELLRIPYTYKQAEVFAAIDNFINP